MLTIKHYIRIEKSVRPDSRGFRSLLAFLPTTLDRGGRVDLYVCYVPRVKRTVRSHGGADRIRTGVHGFADRCLRPLSHNAMNSAGGRSHSKQVSLPYGFSLLNHICSSHQVGALGVTCSVSPAADTVFRPFLWLQRRQAITVLSHVVLPPSH